MTEIFVFGSNLEGFHGKGAAKAALDYHGAEMGVSEGLTGNAYAIPTKGKLSQLTQRFTRLELWQIAAHVAAFKMFAWSRPDLTFKVTKIGCGLAGHRYADIAPMFVGAPQNVKLPPEFQQVIGGR